MRPARLAVVALLIVGCKRHAAKHEPPAARLPDEIPQRTGPIKIDGEWDEDDWAKRALRGQFVSPNGELARPSSEVRFLHDDADLIVALYAADEDIQSTDAFDFTVGTLALHVDSTGKVTPPTPGVRAAVDMDEGTRDNANDDDEEWVVELAIPLAKAGLAPDVHELVKATRCDVPKDKIRRCASWSGQLTIAR